ncbi:MAG: caspase family protein [Methyloligellaceae bacterium]
MKIARIALFSIISLFWMHSQSAAENNKFALLIGNKDYSLQELNLKNPHNDIILLEKSLKKIGFQVHVVRNATYANLLKATNRHASRLNAAGKGATGFFYYSGHGAMNEKTRVNYLIPVEVEDISTEVLWTESVQLSHITDTLKNSAPHATHLVVFDACRNELRLKDRKSKSLKNAKGFTPVGKIRGMLISYATALGKTASDEGKKAGPYARALSEEITVPGFEVVDMFRRVQIRVSEDTGQEPWLSHTSVPKTFLAGEESADVIEWNKISTSDDIKVFRNFMRIFPDSPYSFSAKQMIAQLEQVKQNKSISDEWEQIERSNDVSLLRGFIQKNPSHPYAKLALFRIQMLGRELSDPELNYDIKHASRADRSEIRTRSFSSTGHRKISIDEMTRSLQRELKRVGCDPGEVDGKWGQQTSEAIVKLNQKTGLNLDVKALTLQALQKIREYKKRVCPDSATRPVAARN